MMSENRIVISGPVFIYIMIFVLVASLVMSAYLILKKIIPDIRAGNKVRKTQLVTAGFTLLLSVLSFIAMW